MAEYRIIYPTGKIIKGKITLPEEAYHTTLYNFVGRFCRNITHVIGHNPKTKKVFHMYFDKDGIYNKTASRFYENATGNVVMFHLEDISDDT